MCKLMQRHVPQFGMLACASVLVSHKIAILGLDDWRVPGVQSRSIDVQYDRCSH